MRRNWIRAGTVALALVALAGIATTAAARPVEELPRLRFEDLSAPQRNYDIAGQSRLGVLGAAAGPDTVYFGGTFWNADSSRWQALRDSC